MLAYYELTALKHRIKSVTTGITTDADRDLFLNWVRETYGYHPMLLAKKRFAEAGYGAYQEAYLGVLTRQLAEDEAENARDEGGFDGMPLYGPRPTAAV